MVTVRSSEEDPLACLEGQIYRCLRIGPNPDVSPWIYSFVRDWESWPCVLSLCCEARCSDAAMEPEPEPVEEAEPPVDAEVEAKAAGEKKARPRACDPRSLCLAQSFCVRCCARLALATSHSLANTGQSDRVADEPLQSIDFMHYSTRSTPSRGGVHEISAVSI